MIYYQKYMSGKKDVKYLDHKYLGDEFILAGLKHRIALYINS